MPQAPFLEPSLANNYVTHKYVKPGVEPNPTLRLATQAHHWGHHIVVRTWDLGLLLPPH